MTLKGVKLAMSPPPRTPVYLGALGPEMLRLAGELADGVCLNWCTPEQIAWSRERIAEGVCGLTGTLSMCGSSSISVSAWITMWRSPGGPLPGPRWATPWASGFPRNGSDSWAIGPHFERMGYTAALAELDQMRQQGSNARRSC